MKKIIMLLTLGVFTLAVQAQMQDVKHVHLLKHYYELATALVNSDPVTAAFRITDVINANEGSSLIKASTVQQLNSAGKILEKQREAFAKLSTEIFQWVKKDKPAEIVYQAYCPMKKMYWLTDHNEIKNPYYGKTMLNCGNITETIKP